MRSSTSALNVRFDGEIEVGKAEISGRPASAPPTRHSRTERGRDGDYGQAYEEEFAYEEEEDEEEYCDDDDDDEEEDEEEDEDYDVDFAADGDRKLKDYNAVGEKSLQRVASDYSMDFIPENAGKPLHRLQSGYSVDDFIPEVPLQAAAAARGGIVSRGTPLKVSVSQGGLEKARSRSPPKQTESGEKLLAREQKEEARDSAQLQEKKKKIKKKQVKQQQQQLAELQRRRREEMSAKQEATMFVNEVVLAAMPEHLRKSALAKQLQREGLQPPRSAVDGVGGGGDVYAENEFPAPPGAPNSKLLKQRT